MLGEGIFAWIPERACGQLFDGFLRPDALAGIRVADRAIILFIERDLGTERGEVLAEKIRLYRSVFARALDVPIPVGFCVPSDRRPPPFTTPVWRLPFALAPPDTSAGQTDG